MNGIIDIVDALLVAQFYVDLIPKLSCFTPTPGPTPTPTRDPDIGKVFIYPETRTVTGGGYFTTGVIVYSLYNCNYSAFKN